MKPRRNRTWIAGPSGYPGSAGIYLYYLTQPHPPLGGLGASSIEGKHVVAVQLSYLATFTVDEPHPPLGGLGAHMTDLHVRGLITKRCRWHGLAYLALRAGLVVSVYMPVAFHSCHLPG